MHQIKTCYYRPCSTKGTFCKCRRKFEQWDEEYVLLNLRRFHDLQDMQRGSQHAIPLTSCKTTVTAATRTTVDKDYSFFTAVSNLCQF